MYKITGRSAPVFGKGAFVCDFFCDSASDIPTLPTSKTLGTGGSIPEENEVCAAGSSAYAASDGTRYVLDNDDNWTEHIERSGGSGASGRDGKDGKSAYQIAVETGFEGTESEWLASLKGVAGDDGKSAYDIAVDGGFTGTDAEWLASLKGDKGDAGEKGEKGDTGAKGDKGDKGDAGPTQAYKAPSNLKDGTAGAVPAAAKEDWVNNSLNFLRQDGTWARPMGLTLTHKFRLARDEVTGPTTCVSKMNLLVARERNTDGYTWSGHSAVYLVVFDDSPSSSGSAYGSLQRIFGGLMEDNAGFVEGTDGFMWLEIKVCGTNLSENRKVSQTGTAYPRAVGGPGWARDIFITNKAMSNCDIDVALYAFAGFED